MAEEYIPEGMVLPHGDAEVDADETSRMKLPEPASFAKAEEKPAEEKPSEEKPSEDFGLVRGGLAQYMAEQEKASKPSGSMRFPDKFDLPYREGDDFDIKLN